MRTVPEGFIIPNFGRTTTAPSSDVTTQATSSGSGYAGPRKLVLICSKGNLDMAYPGLVLANAAAGEGIETHMFFTFWGLDIVNTKTNADLKFTIVGNTAMHMPDLGKVRPGLEHWSMPQFMGRLPGMTGVSTKMMNKQMDDLGIPSVPDFLDLLEATGVKMWACRMTFDMMKLIEADLHPAVQGVISATDFMEISEGGQTLFI
ncbi:MAG TPA: DsrE/DsrF/DrsH-like family protein [Planctomycetota bacterium]|nr:DsrE/DsrF/DrsH-like family protein [Planctomycetota bacterium]